MMFHVIGAMAEFEREPSNVHFLARSRVPEGSSRSRNWAVCITVMSALQCHDSANYSIQGGIRLNLACQAGDVKNRVLDVDDDDRFVGHTRASVTTDSATVARTRSTVSTWLRTYPEVRGLNVDSQTRCSHYQQWTLLRSK
jgi:hypothetical protein